MTEALFPDYRPQAGKSAFERVLQAFAQTRLGGKLFLTVLPAIDRRLLPLSRGKLSTGLGQPYLLLHTRGAKSGLERTSPLLATTSGDALLIVASRAGDVRHPGWFYNVRTDPDAWAASSAVARCRYLDRIRIVSDSSGPGVSGHLDPRRAVSRNTGAYARGRISGVRLQVPTGVPACTVLGSR